MTQEQLDLQSLYVMKKEIRLKVKELNKLLLQAVNEHGLRVKVDSYGIQSIGTSGEVPKIEVDVWKEVR